MGFLTAVNLAAQDTYWTNGPPIKPHEDGVHWGMHPAMYALVFGMVSGSSLPLASVLGIWLSPVSDKTCALMMAFGAGALLFAVTVELYGHMLHEVAVGNVGLYEIFTTIFGALAGAAFYLTINQALEDYLMHDDLVETAELVEPEMKTPKGRRASVMHVNETESAPIMAALHAAQEKKEAEDEEEREAVEKKESVKKEAHLLKEAADKKAEKEDDEPKRKRSGAALWSKARVAMKVKKMVSLMGKDELSSLRGREKAMRAAMDSSEIKHAKSVAFALFLGLLVDGIPEGVLMGFLSAEGHLTPVLIISLFVANFPEAFSSSSLLIQAQMSKAKIVGMWTFLCVLVGCLAGGSCFLLLWMFPKFGTGGVHEEKLPMSALVGIALTEGITGGAMIACISSVMLPEAFERAGKHGNFYAQSGFWCVCGFLLSVTLKALFG